MWSSLPSASCFLEASSLTLIIYLSKLRTSETEEIETAISTPRGQKLLKAKCYRGIRGQEKAIYFSQHFTREASGVTPLKQVTSYTFPHWVGPLSEEREPCPPAYMKWAQWCSVRVFSSIRPRLNPWKAAHSTNPDPTPWVSDSVIWGWGLKICFSNHSPRGCWPC